MMFKVRSKLGQAEPVSIVILTGVVLAIALAVYGYFASQAAIASYRQRVQAEIAKLKFNIVVSDLYSNGTDRYILIKRLDTSMARITFSLVLGEFYGETLLVYNTLTDKARVYVLTYSGGLYTDYQISAAQSIPLDRLYTSIDTPLYSGYLRGRGLTCILSGSRGEAGGSGMRYTPTHKVQLSYNREWLPDAHRNRTYRR
jgi:hypothetical protein